MKLQNILAGAAMAAAGCLAVAGVASAAPVVTFVPGTYDLADSNTGPAVDTLVVTVDAGVASFVLSGADNATFSVPDMSTPAGLAQGGANPYYLTASLPAASFSSADAPYLTFWTNAFDGGVTAGSVPGDSGTNLFNTFQSTTGTGQVFTISGVPEPSAWAIMLVGFGGLGVAMRSRRKQMAAAA